MRSQISLEGYPFTEEDLRQVCAAYVEQLCKIEEPLDFEPSQAHREAIQNIMDDALKQGKRRAAFQRIAAAVAIVLLIGSMAFVTNASARDRLENWLRQVLPDKVVYQFFGEPAEKLYEYTIGWLPEGFELQFEERDDVSHTYCFKSESRTCIVSFWTNDAYDETVIFGDGYSPHEVIVNTIKGDLYYGESEYPNDLILFDEERGMIIIINSDISIDEVIHVAEEMF